MRRNNKKIVFKQAKPIKENLFRKLVKPLKVNPNDIWDEDDFKPRNEDVA